MRQTHPAGERMFVDYAGQTVEVIDSATGEVRRAQVFVAVLGASNYTYAEARWTQSLPDWIGCHVGAFASFGDVARQLVCDNLKAGVTAASRYEPGISRTYQDMAGDYGTAVLPARVRRPRDKAKVEVAVQVVQRWVLARLRHRRFFSLAELNGAIRELTIDLNDRPMRHLGTTRRALFEAIERTALLPMPAEPYAYAEWRRCRAGLDYHVEVQGRFYSVPYRLMREVIEARITDQTIELFHQGNRVTCHVRNPRQHRHTTIAEHMPSAHRRHAEWTPTRLLREAEAIGPSTIALVERILAAKPHPKQGFWACLGILRLVRSYGPERLEAACQRGMDLGARTYGSVQSILKNGLDRAELAKVPRAQHVEGQRRATAPNLRRMSCPSRPPARARPRRHGQGARRAAASGRCRRSRLQEPPGHAGRARETRTRQQTMGDQAAVRRPAPTGDAGGCRSSCRPRPRPHPVPEADRRRVDRTPPGFTRD